MIWFILTNQNGIHQHYEQDLYFRFLPLTKQVVRFHKIRTTCYLFFTLFRLANVRRIDKRTFLIHYQDSYSFLLTYVEHHKLTD